MLKKVMLLAALAVCSINVGQMDHPSEFIMVKTNSCELLGCYSMLESNYVVLESEGTAEQNYEKALNWVNTTFRNPDEVLKGQIQNQYIRINGIGSNLSAVNSLGVIYPRDVKYSVTIFVKDDRIKFEINSLEEYISGSGYTSGGWFTFTGIPAYRQNGKQKKTMIPYVKRFENYFNDLAFSLANQEAILEAENSDW